jgi:two-component system heavy metal sensor histidine kinase CusS
LAIRLTAYYAGSAFLIVTVATGYLYWAMARNVDLEDDRTLADKIRLVQSIMQAAPLDVPAIEQEANESWQASQHTMVFIRAIADDGRTIAESPEMGALLPRELFPPPAGEPGRGSNVETKSRHAYRLMAVGNANGIVQVATDRTMEQEILAGYEERLWYALGAALVACAAAGYVIARRGLRPIHQISATAASIRPANLAERITLTGLPAELHQFAGAFNAMLDRLEEAFDRLSRFSADIAHELRTPLNNLRGELDVALQKRRSPEDYAEAIGSSLEECARLGRIIDSLLFLARAEDPQTQIDRETFDLREELGNIREFFEPVAHESGVQIVSDVSAPITASLNRPHFQRALGNLVSNALAHTLPGGAVTLRARSEGEVIVLEVSDTGQGISPDDLPHVFDRFYRADRSRTPTSGGVGLGLAIVKSVAELHRGSVEIESEPGKGTRVRLLFPQNGRR